MNEFAILLSEPRMIASIWACRSEVTILPLADALLKKVWSAGDECIRAKRRGTEWLGMGKGWWVGPGLESDASIYSMDCVCLAGGHEVSISRCRMRIKTGDARHFVIIRSCLSTQDRYYPQGEYFYTYPDASSQPWSNTFDPWGSVKVWWHFFHFLAIMLENLKYDFINSFYRVL